MIKTKKEFTAFFKAEILPSIKEQEKEWQGTSRPTIDEPLRREVWNNLIDSMQKARQLPRHANNWDYPW